MLWHILSLSAASSAIGSFHNTSHILTNHAVEFTGKRNISRLLPDDVLRIVAEHLYYDWTKLLDVFPETVTGENFKFREHVRKCIKAHRIIPTSHPDWILPPIEVDKNGNIWKINLFGEKMTDSAIGELSSLPSTLLVLDLSWNQLTTLDVSILPRGLKHLYLQQNELVNLDLTRLPPELENLEVMGNKLSIANLTNLPRGLKWLYCSHNELKAAELKSLPPTLRFINLEMNHLHDTHFETLPIERRGSVQVCGQGNQKEYGLYVLQQWRAL